MRPSAEISRDLVLVGGGHAHVLALRMLAMQRVSGVRLTLVSPTSHTPYSGMLPGLVAGHYSFEETHVDLSRLCQWAGVRLLAAEVTGIDPKQRILSLRGRPEIGYDLLSIDTGSAPELSSVPGAADWAVPVKPVAGLWQRWLDLSEGLQVSMGESHHIAVVGGGAGSVELILAMAQRLSGSDVRFTLYCGANEILSGYNPRARAAVRAAMLNLGIELITAARVVTVETNRLILADNSRPDFDTLFWCTGAAPAPWIKASGLQTDAQGFIAIRDSLQAMDYDNIFAAGDVATQLNHPRPKAGVYAVRQGPVLARNLLDCLLEKPLKEHIPQQRFLSLISLGSKKATADRGLFSATGEWVWRWKDRIDREFMSRFVDLPELMPVDDTYRLPRAPSQLQAPCGGCGAKIGADSLATVLTALAEQFPQHCPNGGQADDTAVIPGGSGRAIVQSIDVLREMVADPWLMGRIAANHALSDLYASGASPLSALATITLPFATASIQERELKQLLAGAVHEFAAVNCKLLGGHSLQGQELNIGFVVNGSAISADKGLLAKRGLHSGDHLLLTKPLGTGALFAAHMQLRADGRHIHEAVQTMLQSNASAANLAVQHGASACTDVTGFGLLGHLLEMLTPTQGARLTMSTIAPLPGAMESIRGGIVSSMHRANSTAKNTVAAAPVGLDPDVLELLVDPQTSGGLLIGVAADKSAALCADLGAAGYQHAAVIGEVISRDVSGSDQLFLQ